MARVVFAILLGVVVAACAEPRTTKWTGVISGDGRGCDSFGIEITIDKDGDIGGKATDESRGLVSNVWGLVGKSGSVFMHIERRYHQHEALIGRGHIPFVQLYGQLTGSSLSIAQASSVHCDPPRSGVLKRL